ncbi:hypothetical protein MTR_5g026205 [Medicago truncatula]|uniref:Uncharacterized protein n=1 Tax=Medicago truncatula TaxID=3880 RepID=A0A072UDF5_MEDTR|nr:hypothetical protein MTR_5g026205 [Medicago truncatula]
MGWEPNCDSAISCNTTYGPLKGGKLINLDWLDGVAAVVTEDIALQEEKTINFQACPYVATAG